jgi:hypothetical protein
MNADTDFAALYRALGVDPGDGMEAFRRAYRRRVGELHPDRRNDGDGFDLQRLNALYASAIRFHREYGRLPGTSAPAIAGENTIHARAGAIGDAVPVRTENPRNRTGYLLAMAIVLLVVMIFARQQGTDTASPTVDAQMPATMGSPPPSVETSGRPLLEVGSTMRMVLDIQGMPVAADGNRWIYGPSWLRFDCLELVDWYSSPLHPLKTRSARPSASAQRMHRPAYPENCGKTALP